MISPPLFILQRSAFFCSAASSFLQRSNALFYRAVKLFYSAVRFSSTGAKTAASRPSITEDSRRPVEEKTKQRKQRPTFGPTGVDVFDKKMDRNRPTEVLSAAATKKSKHAACNTSGIHNKIIFAISPREPIPVYKNAEIQPMAMPRRNGIHSSTGAPMLERQKNNVRVCSIMAEKNEPNITETKPPPCSPTRYCCTK